MTGDVDTAAALTRLNTACLTMPQSTLRNDIALLLDEVARLRDLEDKRGEAEQADSGGRRSASSSSTAARAILEATPEAAATYVRLRKRLDPLCPPEWYVDLDRLVEQVNAPSRSGRRGTARQPDTRGGQHGD